MTFAHPQPPQLSRSAVLVTLETAGAVLDLQGWQIRRRIEDGTLAAFDLALLPGGPRPAWRIWVPSLVWEADRRAPMAPECVVAAATHDLFRGRAHVLASEIALRCALECSVISRLVKSGALRDPGHRVASYLLQRGGPMEAGKRRGNSHSRLVTRDSWSSLLAGRGGGADAQQDDRPSRTC